MRNPPFISIVIPTYNRSDIVERTLTQLLDQDYPADAYEILVVDNSSDDTPDMVRRVGATSRAPVRLIEGERLPAVKRNQGLEEAQGDLMLYMNDDLWVTREFLSEHARSHQAHDTPVAVLGKCEQSKQMPQTPFIEWYEPFAYWELEDKADQEVPWNYFWTMNISLPRDEMLARNLIFHTDWAEIGNEDVELGYRWTKAGNKIVYNPRAWGEHYHPHSLDSACRLQEQIGRGMRDLEALVPEDMLLARFGIFSWRNPPKTVVRSLARMALFNRVTSPAAKRWLETRERNTALTRWMYWKVLLYYTNRGYRITAPRSPKPVPFTPRAVPAGGAR